MDAPAPETSDKPETGSELHKTALKRYKVAEEAAQDNHRRAQEAMRFRSGDQWPEKVLKQRQDAGRPVVTVDKIGQYIRQVVNDGRQNRPGVKVRPIDDNGDEEIAEALQGIIRHICDRSNADQALDKALEDAVVGGFGYFRVLTEYMHENTFDQEIVVKRMRNPLAVLLDPNAQEADNSDAEYGFVVDEVSKDEFKERWPDAQQSDFEGGKYGEGWITGENVRVCEYWYREEVPTTLLLLKDGTSCPKDEYDRAIAEGVGVPDILESREIATCKVKFCRISGAEVLEENDWLGKYIPILSVYGSEYFVDGKVVLEGLVRPAMDPCRLYNYSRSAFVERVALAPKAPWVAATGQVEDHPEWEDANTENYSVLKYDPLDVNGVALPAPHRTPPADVPVGFAQDMQLSEHDIQSAIGMYAASVGQPSNEKSGRAILARQKEGDTGTFHYVDNLNRAVCYLGRILVDLIPKIYDSPRVIRILGEDGGQETARIDPMQQQAVKKEGANVIYNLNVGTYDVSVTSGPSYTTRRQEAADSMVELTRANPALMPLVGDLMIRNMDWPGADAIADRLKIMLPPQIAQAEQPDGPPPEVQAIMAQAQQAMQEKDAQLQQVGQVVQESQSKVQDLERTNADLHSQLKAQADALKNAQERVNNAAIAKDIEAASQLTEEQRKVWELEQELKQERATQALEDIQEQTIEQIKALLVPTPAVETPAPVAPPGPSPEVAAILEQMANQTQAVLQAVSAPKTRKVIYGPNGRPDSVIEVASQ